MKLSTHSEIGSRIAQERKALGLTQEILAERIGITKSRLASYEDARGCLRCGIALDICHNLMVSERWLATGKGNKSLYRDVRRSVPEDLLHKPFLEIYLSHIETIYHKMEQNSEGNPPFIWNADDHPETIKLAFFKRASFLSQSIDDKWDYVRYWAHLDEAAEIFSGRFTAPQEERLTSLNDELAVRKNGDVVPFSYKRFFRDLKPLGLLAMYTEEIAENIREQFIKDENPIPIEKLREFIHSELLRIDAELKTNFGELYRMIYIWEK